MMKPGLYEQIISQHISEELDSIAEPLKAVEDLDQAEAPQVLAGYVAEATRAALETITEEDSDVRVKLVNEVIQVLSGKREELEQQSVKSPAQKLLQVLSPDNPDLITGTTAAKVPRPETSMAMSSLFTGSAHEPPMFMELQKEIATADRIDMLVSFIKWSGLRLIIDQLKEFTQRGGLLRVITTSYMGATEVKAVDEIAALPNTEIKVSYDTSRTRLHAKTYVFYRDTGFTTAYVGSSNLSNAAMSNGLEWNMKLTAKDQPDTLRKINVTFDSYWNSDEFEFYSTDAHQRLATALKGENTVQNQDSSLTSGLIPISR